MAVIHCLDRRSCLLFFFLLHIVLGVRAQSINVKGTVYSEDDMEPVIGASVMVKGSKAGTVTDVDGQFRLSSVPAGSKLVVSYLGMQTREVEASSAKLKIVLRHETHDLGEVVVTATGKTMSADKMGSTASVISTDRMLKSGNPLLINELQGKAAGVSISSPNGDVGSGSNITIRGANTFIGESQPLVILDGSPISNEYYEGSDAGNITEQSRLNDINPNDIESIQVLKGASAAALWGSRAANGVIVITTKSGTRNAKPQISYSYSKSVDWVAVRHPIQSVWGQGTGGKYNKNTNLSWGDKIADRAGGEDEYDTSGAYFVSDLGNTYYPIVKKNSTATYTESNWDAVFHNGSVDQHNFSIGGGNDKATYFASYGGTFQNGVLRNTYYNKHNARFNASYRFADWIKLSAKFAYIHSSSNRVYTNGDTTDGAYLALLRNPADFDIRDYKGTYVDASGVAYTNRQRMYRNEIGANRQPTYNNPLWSIYEQKALDKLNRFILTPELVINPLSWLDVTLRGGVDYYHDDRDTFFPVNSSYKTYSSGYYDYFTTSHRELTFDALVRASKSFSRNFVLHGSLGYSLNDRHTIYNDNRLSSFDVDARLLSSSLAASNSASSWTKTVVHRKQNRGYAIVDAELFNQLFLTLTGMEEASSTVSGRYFYPSADIAWQFSNLMKPNRILSFGKLRASWGKVGTEPEPYRMLTLAESTNASFGGSYAVSSSQGNANLKPEVKTEWEIGADLRLFDNALDLKLTYYRNVTKNLLFDVALNPSSGYSTRYSNEGKMRNNGIEAELQYHVIDTKDFKWDVNATFNKNANKVLSLGGTGVLSIGGSSVAIEGYPLGVLYRPGALRDADGNMVLDSNGFPKLSNGNVVLGDPNPDWKGGLGFSFSYKDLDFSFLFEHSQGGKFLNRTQLTLYGFGVHEDVSHEVTLTKDLVNYAGKVFKAGTTVRGNIYDFGAGDVLLDESWYNGLGGGLGTNKINDLYVYDNTWTKLRNVTIGYTLRLQWLKTHAWLNAVRFSVTGRDLICWSNLVGVDPESNNYGISNARGMDYFSSPATRSVVFNVQLTF